jgi:hypothetical protein
MTAPSQPPRPFAGRSSFALAMKDYTFIRPGIAVSISAVTLVAALIIGAGLIRSLQRAATTVEQGARTSETLHRYNFDLEVWREMVTSTDPADQRPEGVARRDSVGRALRAQLAGLASSLTDTGDRGLVHAVLKGMTRTQPSVRTEARQAMIALLARQDDALFQAAKDSQRAVLHSAILLALTVLAAGMLVIPMAWLYLRHKRGARGATIEVKV